MRRLPGILSLIAATLIVIVALLISGLRLLMPHMNEYRTEILSAVSSLSGTRLSADELTGRWENFGPVVEVRGLHSTLNDGTTLGVSHVRLALDVWQSLLHARLQFRDLTFWQLQLSARTLPRSSSASRQSLGLAQVENLFLRRFDHFILRDSQISFPSLSGQQVHLAIPQLTWFNEGQRHRAEGEVSLSSITGQHGVVQVRLDLNDINGMIDSGRVWLQAESVDAKPWLGRWMKDNTTLRTADFSLQAWVNLKGGVPDSGDLLLTQGSARWQAGQEPHQLTVDNLTAHLFRTGKGWALSVPRTGLATDDVAWPQGSLSLYWQPEEDHLLRAAETSEIRLRATRLDLQRIAPLVPLLAPLAPELTGQWRTLQPTGDVDSLAIDFSLPHPEQSRFLASWHNLSWQAEKQLPAVSYLSGKGRGRFDQGEISLSAGPQNLTVGDTFKAPLEMQGVTGTFRWDTRDGNLLLSGENVVASARSLKAAGNFRYQQRKGGQPRLDILAGMNVTDAGDAWRYFPHHLMGKGLTDYLSGAIKGGQTQNATLIFAGDPHNFPFRRHDGVFQVYVPLRDATYAFQPDWPALQHQDIDLNFVNDGLWMKAAHARLGNAVAENLTADITDYRQEKLIINGDVSGSGQDIHDYFRQTPLAKSLAATLAQLQIQGKVAGHLNLDIPLDGKQVTATGDVRLNNNSLYIKPLKTRLTQMTGQFRYQNGALESDTLHAQWYGQPVAFSFSTHEQEKDFAVDIALQSQWHPAALKLLPASLRSRLSGQLPWQGNVSIRLPYHGGADYQVAIKGDAKEVSSHLPSPLSKDSGSAFPFEINVKGDLNSFLLSGSAGKDQKFISRWLLEPQFRLDRGQWQDHTSKLPALPASPSMILNLPALQGEEWLALFGGNQSDNNALKTTGEPFNLPGNITLHTPSLSLGGQNWNDLTVLLSRSVDGATRIAANGKEIRGQLQINPHRPWQVNFDYLYYNPQWPSGSNPSLTDTTAQKYNFGQWPALQLDCAQCWLTGQNLGKLSARLTPSDGKLVLTNGLLDAGHTRLNVSGEWDQSGSRSRTSLKGEVTSHNITRTLQWFGVNSPLQSAPVKLDYDLHWQKVPWQPDLPTLSGLLKVETGKGEITSVNTGAAGQLLRLVSVDALLRKMRFDFRDTFSNKGFYFDAIKGTAWIENGVLRTDNLFIDGLEADITMQGDADFVRRRLDFNASVAPELSASVGVATAFVINPVVGAAVFAASKALAPLWNKISLLRYHIGGTLDDPQINEILRKPRAEK
ncbi:AsmA2 domain-containing protein YhdP [Tatumella sp. JGM118]|uniref:AsmA2 domain-containing protein YhdP n=1 Tax=Tatumella sp. JGM118 TaxID=2799796 RepID=UPI001BB04C4B|nr:AsmA2 domain-containing protein YhdP [Tatumella sp. JGM118]